MGSKVEYIALIFIALVAGFAYFLQTPTLKNSNPTQELSKKETEVNNFIEYEINATATLHTLKAKNAYKMEDVWYVKEPNITTKRIKILSSKEATSSKQKVVFLKDVYALRDDNATYNSQKAIYLKDKRKFITPGKFILIKGEDKVTGKELIYKANTKETFAKDVKGKFKLKDTKK